MKKLLFILLFALLYPVFILATDMVDINTASLEQLDTLTGIGPVYAQRIIDGRPYSSVDDLLRVSGIGEKTLQKIKYQGLAYVGEKSEIQNSNDETVADEVTQPTPDVNENPTSGVDDAENATTPAITYPTEIFINEILPNPEGTDEENEWIELYNSNSFDVDLSGWQIKDMTGSITTFTIPKNIKISANGFLTFKRPETKITLNNNEDGINLLTPDKKIVDSITFMKAPLGQSYNKTSGNWLWSTILTPGAKNVIPAANNLSKTKNSVNNNIELGLADINQIINPAKSLDSDRGASPWFLFFTALAITIISASIVLLIKLRFSKKTT